MYAGVKRAVKAVFGGASAEYKQLSTLAFRRIKVLWFWGVVFLSKGNKKY